MWMKWLPWRYVVSRVAKSQGFLDPLTLMARLRQFAQPSEVAEPVELLRAGAVFHARGLINSRAIQHNLDWVWPYWAERQFDPLDDSFVPRAFSITHVNLTHRNWTAVGQPDCDWLPIVDPRGLVTPLFDGWSLDAWIVPTDAEPLLPSRRKEGDQWLRFDEHNLHVETRVADDHSMLESIVEMVWDDDQPVCQLRIHGQSRSPGWLVVSLRPTNPEGVAFIHRIDRDDERTTLTVDETATVHLDRPPERLMFSEYRRGDVYERVLSVAGHRQLPTQTAPRSVKCEVGLATAAAMYRLDEPPDYPTSGQNHTDVVVRVPLVDSARAEPTTQHHAFAHHRRATTWQTALADTCRIVTPDDRINELYEAAVRSLLLHSPDDCYPGPYTYKRFWFRDAAFLVHGLLTMGASERAARVIERFPLRQKTSGYFHSQEGEWDSNGQVLWIIERWQQCTRSALSPQLLKAVRQGARWIRGKRTSDSIEEAHAGLMPAGFSAEHLGPNDYYYWDDFWSVAGLLSAATLLRQANDPSESQACEEAAAKLIAAIERSLQIHAAQRSHPGLPASPYRRMDAGAIGSLAVGYPLQLWPPDEPRLLSTVEYLLQHCLVHGGFFQDMIHSGINAYLTLHMAQVLLRAGDSRYRELMQVVVDWASPTGQWPEAIHPITRGGCMGDGQHIWAAAEWIVMLRNCFVQEEPDRLILGGGIPEAWIQDGDTLRCGPTLTRFGAIEIEVENRGNGVEFRWQGDWHGEAPSVEIRLDNHQPRTLSGANGVANVARGTNVETTA